MDTLYVGLDVSSNDIVSGCMLHDGTDVGSHRVTLNLPGVAALGQKLDAILPSHGLQHVVLGLESTSVYGFHLPRALQADPSLRPFTLTVLMFQARAIQRFKKSENCRPKNDTQDACFVAETLRTARPARHVDVEDRHKAFRRLTRHCFHLVQTITAQKHRFSHNLFPKRSPVAQEPPIKQLCGPTAATILVQMPSVEELAATPLDKPIEILVSRSRGRLRDPAEVARALQKAAKASFRLPRPRPMRSTSRWPPACGPSATWSGKSRCSTPPSPNSWPPSPTP